MALPKFWHMYRLTRQPELTFSGNGMEICKVGLACSEKYGDKETQLFIDGTAFKTTAKMLSTVQKGHRVMVFGKISTESWQDKDTGQKRSKTVMVIESFEFVEPKQQGQQPQSNGGFQQQNHAPFQQAPANQYPQQQPGNFQQTPDYSGGGFNQQNSNNHQDFSNTPPDDSDIPFSCNIC